MMKKYIPMSIILFQLSYIFPAQTESKRHSDAKKTRSELSKSQPILIFSSKKDEDKRLSQSSPNLLQAYSPYHYSPNGYYELGNLSENNFSPATYNSNR